MQVVAYDSAANAGRRIEVLTERRDRGETRSHLVIDDARPDVDSGNYTCKPSIARPASIKVHVLESECSLRISCFCGAMLTSLLLSPINGE